MSTTPRLPDEAVQVLAFPCERFLQGGSSESVLTSSTGRCPRDNHLLHTSTTSMTYAPAKAWATAAAFLTPN